MKVKVISVFRDKFTGKYYTPGEVIEVSEESRVLDMESRRLAERVEAKTTEVKAPEEKKEVKISLFEKEFEKKALVDALKAIGIQASGNMKEETLLAKVAELDEETTAKLKEALNYKTCYLTFAEAFALAKRSKKIVSLSYKSCS